ncbi:MAG: hypothetical protein ACMUIS_03015 [bacterium]
MDERAGLPKIRTTSIRERKSRVRIEDFSRPLDPGLRIAPFFDHLPNILAGKTLRGIISAVARAHAEKRGIIWAMGAHVIKCGLSPILIDLMERGLITTLALNGAGLIHDFEIALFGETSEDVEEGLNKGEFGMAAETGELLNKAINTGVEAGSGIGEGVGRWLAEHGPQFRAYSLVARAYDMGIPVTVHVAIGTDIIHMHPSADGARIGEGSMRDFHRLVASIQTLDAGGIYFNIGSAVILPEVFLKAVSMIVSGGVPLNDYVTVNMDFIRHYRPLQNVVKRPVAGRGRGYSLIGHHELLIPLVAAGIREEIAAGKA